MAESSNRLVPQLALYNPNQCYLLTMFFMEQSDQSRTCCDQIVTSHEARNNELDVSLREWLFE